jgi:predicted site-specific integrase-resolvase
MIKMKKNSPFNLSTKEFATRTGLAVATITKMLRKGQIKGKKRSGRWMIAEDQLNIKAVVDIGRQSSSSKNRYTPPKTAFVKTASSIKDYTVGEFSQITYLTEFGVKVWLKLGKIKGYQDEKGQWRVDADSLNMPNIRHLVRK